MRNMQEHLENEHGATLVATGLALVAFIAFAIVGVDLGRLAFTATEVQTLADVSATAGANALFIGHPVVQEAKQVAGANNVDGQIAQIAPPGRIAEGYYDFATETFVEGGQPRNAVKAYAEAEVTNFLAGITMNGLFGDRTTVVKKEAIAAFGPPASGRPTLPIAFDECQFPNPDCTQETCLPTLKTVPSPTDNSGWTGFLGGSGQTEILSYFPAACRGDGQTSPPLYIGNDISLNNGDITPLFNAVRCMVCELGITEFLIPVVDDGDGSCDTQFNQTGKVSGFATITVDKFVLSNGSERAPCASGGGAIKGIVLSAMLRADGSGPPGDTDSTGTFGIRLVRERLV